MWRTGGLHHLTSLLQVVADSSSWIGGGGVSQTLTKDGRHWSAISPALCLLRKRQQTKNQEDEILHVVQESQNSCPVLIDKNACGGLRPVCLCPAEEVEWPSTNGVSTNKGLIWSHWQGHISIRCSTHNESQTGPRAAAGFWEIQDDIWL